MVYTCFITLTNYNKQIINLKEKMSYNIYVTVGATISFDGIVDTLFKNAESNLFKQLASLNSKNKSTINLVVQCGDTYESLYKKHIEPRSNSQKKTKFMANLLSILDTNYCKNSSIKLNEDINLNVIFFKLTTNINKLLAELKPDLFITHAGTGSLLDALNIENVKIIAVVNTSLMNNHQLEIAEKFEEYGVITCCNSLANFKNLIKGESLFVKNKADDKPLKKIVRGYKQEFDSDILLF